MEIGIAVNIRTPYGELVLIPQDRNLLQASSGDPFQFGGNTILLWAIERIHRTWGISRVIEPLLHMIDGSGRISSIAGESVAAELLKTVSLLAGEWAEGHPDAFEGAAAAALKYDLQGLNRELEALKESLMCSALAIESITVEASPEHSALLRAYSQNMRTMAFDVPAMQQIIRALSYRGRELNLPMALPSSAGAPAAGTKANHLRGVTRSRKGSNQRVIGGTTNFGQSSWANQPTLGRFLKKHREEIGLSRQDLALKLGVKASRVAQLESDSSPRPSFQLLSRVAGIFGLDKDRLFQLAERDASPSSAARRAVTRSRDTAQVWRAFARDRALLERHNVRPQELKALLDVSLMGKINGSESLLFILDAIRDAEETEK